MSFLEGADCLRPGGIELTKAGLALCALPKGAVLADIGSGKGLTVHLLRTMGFAAFGVDIAPCGINIPQIKATAENLPLQRATLDGVICECVLCLVSEPAKVLRNFAEVTRIGGWLLLTDLYLRKNLPNGEACSIADVHSMQQSLQKAGWALRHFSDHTNSLISLAAQACWNGKSGCMPWETCGYGNTKIPWKSCGYGLWVAQKE